MKGSDTGGLALSGTVIGSASTKGCPVKGSDSTLGVSPVGALARLNEGLPGEGQRPRMRGRRRWGYGRGLNEGLPGEGQRPCRQGVTVAAWSPQRRAAR